MEESDKAEVGDRVESDHHPVVLWMTGKWEGERKKRGKKEKTVRGDWSREGKERFRAEVRWQQEDREGGGIEEEIKGMIEEIKRAMELGEGNKGTERREGWWDEELREGKKGVRRALREWRRGKVGREEYRDKKPEYNKNCEEKKKEENERFIKEAEGNQRRDRARRVESLLHEAIRRERGEE